jgi:ribonuclease BN (tRNA processing enzyme)
MSEIQFIGTSSGFAEKERFHSQIVLKTNRYNLLFDTPDGCTKALFYADLRFDEIDGIVITHFHPDHVSGLASLIQQMKLSRRRKRLDIFVHDKLKNALYKLLALTYIFIDKLNFRIEITTFDNGDIVQVSKNIAFRVFDNSHIKNKRNVVIPEVEFISSSFLVETEKGNFVYTSDVGDENDLFIFPRVPLEFYISEFTHIDFSAFEKIAEIYKPGKILLTHYLQADAEKHVSKENVLFVRDGESLSLSR